MTVVIPKTLARALLTIACACMGLLALLTIVALSLRGVVTDLRDSARRQDAVIDAQDAAQDRSECLTAEYKEFFAGTAQTLYALVTDSATPQSAVRRLERAARVLPDIDTICAP